MQLRPTRNLPAAYVSRGWAYGKTAEYERAIADYTSAIALDAKNVDAYKSCA